MKRKLTAISLVAVLFISGCNGYTTAEKVTHVVAVIVTLAQGDIPAFQQAGAFSPQEAAAAQGYLAVVSNLNSQYGACIDAAQAATLKTNGKFLACLNIFLSSATDPKELAQFRVFNPKAQQRIQLWIAAIQLGVNTAIAALGGATQPVVQVSTVSVSEQREFNNRVMEGM